MISTVPGIGPGDGTTVAPNVLQRGNEPLIDQISFLTGRRLSVKQILRQAFRALPGPLVTQCFFQFPARLDNLRHEQEAVGKVAGLRLQFADHYAPLTHNSQKRINKETSLVRRKAFPMRRKSSVTPLQ